MGPRLCILFGVILSFCVVDKVSEDYFKYDIILSLKAKYRLKLDQYVVLNNFREKGNLWYKLLYKVFEIIYVYDPLRDIYLFSTLIPLSNFLYGIQHSVKTVSKWIFIAIFFLHFLFLLIIWITAAQMMTKKRNECWNSSI